MPCWVSIALPEACPPKKLVQHLQLHIVVKSAGVMFWYLAGGDINESKFTWHSSMHTKGLLPAGDRPQLRRVSLTLENLNFTYIAAVQFMGGWHWHFTSLDAKNSTDMIKIVGLSSSSLSKSPGPTWQDNRFLAIFYYEMVKYLSQAPRWRARQIYPTCRTLPSAAGRLL